MALTGCVAKVYDLQRLEMVNGEKNASGDAIRTDGILKIIELNDCEAPATVAVPSDQMLPWRPNSRWKRLARAQALSIHDLWRSNVIYISYDLSLTVIRSLRNRRGLEYETRRHIDGGSPYGGAN